MKQLFPTFTTEDRILLDAVRRHQNRINGIVKKEKSEIKLLKNQLGTAKKDLFDKRETAIHKISEFWSKIFLKLEVFSNLGINCMSYLVSIKVDDINDGYQIRFFFDTNPYFINIGLTKQFRKKFAVTKRQSLSIPIKWRPNVTYNQIMDRAGTSQARDDVKSLTFVSWYTNENLSIHDPTALFIKNFLWNQPVEFFRMAHSVPV